MVELDKLIKQCSSDAITQLISSQVLEELAKICKQTYTVYIHGFVDAIGKINVNFMTYIPAWGKCYAVIPILVDRYVIEKLTHEFEGYSTGRKTAKVVIKYTKGFEVEWNNKKLEVIFTYMPLLTRVFLLRSMWSSVGLTFLYTLPTGEAIYFLFPSPSLLSAKLPPELEVHPRNHVIPLEEHVRITGWLIAQLVISKCIACVLREIGQPGIETQQKIDIECTEMCKKQLELVNELMRRQYGI